jgi:hypothetical protein
MKKAQDGLESNRVSCGFSHQYSLKRTDPHKGPSCCCIDAVKAHNCSHFRRQMHRIFEGLRFYQAQAPMIWQNHEATVLFIIFIQ